jgi:hypothetical protein
MTFADFQSELLNHEMLLENQQQQNTSADTGTFAFYSNKPGQSTLLHQSSNNFRNLVSLQGLTLDINSIH